jgi:light-regulated signal transduction histidine kinase (bacteriophytochrome)
MTHTLGGKVVGLRWLLRDGTERKQVQRLLQATHDELEQLMQQRTAALSKEIAEHQRAERALTQQAEELRRSNTELQQFAYVASHDLQEPLFVVSTALHLLLTRAQGKLDAEAKQFTDYALKGTQQIQTMIADLLTYARVDAQGKPFISTDSAAVLKETLQTLHVRIADSKAVITTDLLPLVRGDKVRLTLLFQNLLSNALKFRSQAPPCIHFSARRQGAEWVFAVQDNGIGIALQHAERIFQVFQRVHTASEYPGTGIGLAICKKIVEQHGGRIWVESAPGGGATFFFTLPAA